MAVKGGKQQLKRTGPVTFKGINPFTKSRIGKGDVKVTDLSTIVEIDMKEIETPSILRKKK